MNKKKLDRVFDRIKTEANLDYAIIEPDEYGDCNTCVNDALAKAYGLDSKGIWIKHWLKGMNASKPLEEVDFVYIAHDITDEQAGIVLRVLREEGYILEDSFSHDKCIKIQENEDLRGPIFITNRIFTVQEYLECMTGKNFVNCNTLDDAVAALKQEGISISVKNDVYSISNIRYIPNSSYCVMVEFLEKDDYKEHRYYAMILPKKDIKIIKERINNLW